MLDLSLPPPRAGIFDWLTTQTQMGALIQQTQRKWGQVFSSALPRFGRILLDRLANTHRQIRQRAAGDDTGWLWICSKARHTFTIATYTLSQQTGC
jgi:hypothetical protein